jgi:hypothetical protein
LAGNPAGGLALLEKAGFIDDQNRILVCEMFDHIVTDDVTQRIGIPAAASQNGLLAPGSRIARRLRAHPARFAPLIPQKPIQKQACAGRHPLLREQRPHPRFYIPQR